MPDENKTLVRRLFEETWNRRNPGIADELIGPTYVSHDPSSPDFGRGPEAYKRNFNLYVTAFPDMALTVDSVISEGDLVAARWTATGTHRGHLNDLAPTGRNISVSGITVARVSGGKIHEIWNQWDALGMLRQLGAVPSRRQAAGSHPAEF